MNPQLRRMLFAVPGMQAPYQHARRLYTRFRVMRKAGKYFSNLPDYRRALLEPQEGRTIMLHSKDGLQFTVRQNYMDASILAEVFLDRDYIRGFKLGRRPVVVDIGGYIGDFAIFAARYLDASCVIVVEPSPDNWQLLTRNIVDNHYADTITPLHMAVTDGGPLLMDVDAPERVQARVSADYYGKPKATLREVPGISLEQLIDQHHLAVIDLLKIDCEGGEYTILLGTPADKLARVRNLVFEFHEIPGFAEQLDAVRKRLADEGFTLRTQGHLVYASRS